MKQKFWDIFQVTITSNFKPNTLVNLFFPEEDLCLGYIEISHFLELYFDISGEVELEKDGRTYSQSEIEKSKMLQKIVKNISSDFFSNYKTEGWKLTKTPELTLTFDSHSNVRSKRTFPCHELQGEVWLKSILLSSLKEIVEELRATRMLHVSKEHAEIIELLDDLHGYSVRTSPFHSNNKEYYFETMMNDGELLNHIPHIEGEVNNHFINFLWLSNNQKATERIVEILRC